MSDPASSVVSPALARKADELVPLFYADIRKLARFARLRVGADGMMQTTALVHDAYLKLRRAPGFNDEAHFLRAAAIAMRQVLINYARESSAEKRGGGAHHTALDPEAVAGDSGVPDEDDGAERALLALNGLLQKLEQLNPRLSRVVECRFFAGYSVEDVAKALDLDVRTVHRDWTKARAWLRKELEAAGIDLNLGL